MEYRRCVSCLWLPLTIYAHSRTYLLHRKQSENAITANLLFLSTKLFDWAIEDETNNAHFPVQEIGLSGDIGIETILFQQCQNNVQQTKTLHWNVTAASEMLIGNCLHQNPISTQTQVHSKNDINIYCLLALWNVCRQGRYWMKSSQQVFSFISQFKSYVLECMLSVHTERNS